MSQSKTAQPVLLTASEKKYFLDLINRFANARILVIGDFILDQFIWGSVDRISPEAPVPVVNVNSQSYMPGGSLNVANNIHTLGGTVYPCGAVGRDLEGRMLVKVIRREGINTGGIIYDTTRPTSLKTRVIAHSQQVVRFDRENPGDVPAEALKKILKFVQQQLKETDVVIIEDYGKGVIQPALIKQIVKLAKRLKKPVLVDPKEKNFSYYSGATLVTPNRKEAYSAFQALTRRKAASLEEVGKGLIKAWKAEAVLVTLGEDGMALFEKNGPVTKIPTTAREVYDVSGAGDTVIGVLALALALGAKMKDAAKLSNVAAGVVVGKLGTATVSTQELREAVESFAGSRR
jgi:D-glycero-beta-D-manno-heptose-7-phosphate kinase